MITIRIDAADRHAHAFAVTLTIPAPDAEQVVSLPVWIPGSYLVREFARHLSGLQARQGRRVVAAEPIDKASWTLRCSGSAPLVLRYRVHAFDTSVRAAFLDARRGFFNATSLVLRARGHEALPHRLTLTGLPAGWQVATAMDPADGANAWQAADYDELADHPFELGRFWLGRFEAGGVPHEFVVAGAWPDFDGERLLEDTRRICAAAIAFWHGRGQPPMPRYVFLLNAVDDGHGGLEHRASTALLAARRDLPRRGDGKDGPEANDGYVGLLGLISHEYFHTWNVKRLRPAEFAQYDYTQENHTRLLWFFEGFTSYYDDLLLVRAGLIDAPRYLKLVAKTIAGVRATPGAGVQSVAQASFDAWIKYYRPDENTPNATVSYYAKGSLVALCLDLTLRAEGHGTLDDVLRRLWKTSRGGPISEADIADALAAVGRRRFDAELARWVHGTDTLPLDELLGALAVTPTRPAATLAQRLGLRISESALTGVKATHVLRGGAAERAGIAAGDELLGAADWRLRRLDDLLRIATPGKPVALLVARDQQLLTLPLTVPPVDEGSAPTCALVPAADAPREALARRKAWIGG
jgi:predicted metalloprotease with PDZ domain